MGDRAEGAKLPSDAHLGVATTRLRLTPVVAADADDLFPVLDDARLHQFIGGTPPTRAQLRERFARWQTRAAPDGSQLWLNWVVRLGHDPPGVAVGYVQATVADGRAFLAYVIGTPWAGQGIATEAVRVMCEVLRRRVGISRWEAHIHPRHLASAGVARRAGLAPAGEVDDDGEEVWTGGDVEAPVGDHT